MNCPRRHMCWQSKRFYHEGAPGWRAAGWGDPGGLLCHVAHRLGFYGDGISFQGVFSQSSWLRVFPGGARITQPTWMPARRILGGGRTCGVSFWLFLNSSGWWWLISSVFLTQDCLASNNSCKWWLWCLARVGGFSVLPLTTAPWEALYLRYFLGIGAEVSFSCNFFLLCMGVGLPSRAEVSLNLI